MKIATLLLLALVAFAGSALAQTTPVAASLFDGLSVTAGFQWDHPSNKDLGLTDEDKPPFFVGGELRLPLNGWSELGGTLDREFTDSPRWSARVFVSAHPWRR